nr:ribonuclease H-like domain-containing protein [Tanacetum cinerariifolium]
MESQLETTQTVSGLKLPVLKTEEYDLWSMGMEQYLTFIDHTLWEVIVNGDSVSPVASASVSAEGLIPPKTAEQKLARKNELKPKSTLMLAIPDEHILKFHACKDKKSLCEVQCGVSLINGICLNYTYGDGKSVTCCGCEGPLSDVFCWFCDSRAGNSFAYDSNLNSFDNSQNLSDYPSQPQYETYLCELCGNDSHYGYDCPPRFSLVYEQEPSYNQNYNDNYYPHNLPIFLYCANYEGPHESFQCKPMNQNNFEPNHFGVDQPPQYAIYHQPLIIQENLNQKLISDEFMTEPRNELFKAMQSMFEEHRQREQAANLSTHTSEPSRRFNYIFYDDDDDDDDDDEERTIPLRDIISQLPPSIVITTSPPVLPTFKDPEDSLIIRNEDLNNILENKSNEFIKSSVQNLVPIPSESEDISGSDSECDLSLCENNSMSGNPTPSSYSEVESLSPSPIPYEDSDPLLEETDILLSHFDSSLPGGSTTTHSDFSLFEYDSFIFDLSIDLFPPAAKCVSHHEEFADELTHIISSSEYDCFYFDTETDSGELTILFKENISKDSTKEFTCLEFNDFPLILSDCDSTFSKEFYEINLLVSFLHICCPNSSSLFHLSGGVSFSSLLREHLD